MDPQPITADPRLDQMRVLIESGRSVRAAAKEVFGRIATYYEQTTEAERKTVYCKPQQAEGFRVLRCTILAKRANELEALARAEGKDISRFLNQLIVERLTLNK